MPPAAFDPVRAEQQLQRPLVVRPVVALDQAQGLIQNPGGQRQFVRGLRGFALGRVVLPALHPLQPVVGAQHRPLHAGIAQPRLNTLQRPIGVGPLAQGFRNERAALFDERSHLAGQQFKVPGRSQQLDLCQVLCQQARKMIHVLRRLGGAHCDLAPGARVFGAHHVMEPAQCESAGTQPASGQPASHLHQQAPGAEQQGGCRLHPRHQLQPRMERLRQHDPSVGFGPQPVGLVQSHQQGFVKPAAQATARQLAHIPQRAAAHARQSGLVLAYCREGVQRQAVQNLRQRRPEPIPPGWPRAMACQGHCR